MPLEKAAKSPYTLPLAASPHWEGTCVTRVGADVSTISKPGSLEEPAQQHARAAVRQPDGGRSSASPGAGANRVSRCEFATTSALERIMARAERIGRSVPAAARAMPATL